MEMPKALHEWDVSYEEARDLQETLARKVRLEPLPSDIKYVAGADMSLSKPHDTFFAGVVVMRYPDMDVVETHLVRRRAHFPYIPGLLSFREGPALLAAFAELETEPDVIMFDDQGIAHPRRFGLAAHLGLWLSIPSVGCAKSRLIGEHEEPGEERGSWTSLMDEGERIGTVLRTRTGVKPLFVSPGHLCDHAGARRLVLDCATRYKMPETTRQAHLAVGKEKRAFLAEREAGEE